VIADPARQGLGRRATEVLLRTGAGVVVLVSCDPVSFARDARLLADAGAVLERAVVLDPFPFTSHVEVVGRFVRA
jgi:23S rRNA (uracil1939-C5)-methyltransferase